MTKIIDVTYRMEFGDDGILRKMVTLKEEAVNPADAIDATCIATAWLNVRATPVDGTVVGALTYLQKVKVLEQSLGWSRIEAPPGWVSSKYLSFK
jgi:hypothetical protein